MKDIKLLIPEFIYAVPGVEMNLYYDNIVSVINSKNYVFEVHCEKGRMDEDRWRFVPDAADAGEYEWKIRVHDENGIVAEAVSKLLVAPIDAGKDEEFSVMMLGDSQMAAKGVPSRVYDLMKGDANPKMTMIGSNGVNYASPEPDGVAHEGWGGWGWKNFFSNWGITETDVNDGLHPRQPWVANSRFLFSDVQGNPVFDFEKYCDKYAKGKTPDVIFIMLGINNLFFGTDSTMQVILENDVYPYMKKMFYEFRRVSKSTRFAVGLLPPCTKSQDAFGANYGCQQTRWQIRKNLDLFNRFLIEKSEEFLFETVPVYINLDTINNFPEITEAVNKNNSKQIVRQSNAFHPELAGYNQIGDTIYSWLKNVFL